ncbi:hypothetical protein CSV75_07640 [Sporosarcina sp. P18a]|uniref:reverse transcriptase domain-containing protein n=1 Tax=Sporosarcina sp. P18a TaxID=2048259 RepID=UPI000C172CA4|nr:reverse transcriptase domain-containing protein [Sporosarcina sp. P18a]PIC81631.1 hypothetical protein CSV75_07640 [Sporosarcina sp. P18a]
MEKDTYINFLYFGYKKAKHFVNIETSFTDPVDILSFEKDLKSNIDNLYELLENPEELVQEINRMKGYLYFFPKSNGQNDEVRMRPKVSFPFKYQVLWATIILIIGEWFDTNEKIKNTYSICDENIREKFNWMVPWSFNGRLKRLSSTQVVEESNTWTSSYIHYNDKKLYESHQMALRKFNYHKTKEVDKLLTGRNKVFIGELDIKEFFPTLKKVYIEIAINKRLAELRNIKDFDTTYFNTKTISSTIKALLQIEITYPDVDNIDKSYLELLKRLFENLNPSHQNMEFDVNKLVLYLNSTLPLDLIASNFLSNCTLNHFVDKSIQSYIKEEKKQDEISILRYTDDYVFMSRNEKTLIEYIKKVKSKIKSIELKTSLSKTLPTNNEEISMILDELEKTKKADPSNIQILKEEINKLEVDPVDYDENLKQRLTWLGIKIYPNSITESCIETSHITKSVSTTVDTKLKALSDQELNMFIQEMLFYMSANNDLGELKEETVKIFAAWRLKNSYHEIIHRTTLKKEQLSKFFCLLTEAVKKYPYKMGFYDVYILMILKLIQDQDDGYDKLKKFLLNLSSHIGYSNKNNLVYFSTIRARILNIISTNWYAFTEMQRNLLRNIFNEVFLTWYAMPFITWPEKFELYWSLSIMRLRLPLQLCNIDNECPNNLRIMYIAYNEYIFAYPKKQVFIEKEFINSDNILMTGIEIFKRGLYWDRNIKEYSFNEIDSIIYNVINKEILSEENKDITNWLAFAKISCKTLNKNLLLKLDDITDGRDLGVLLQGSKKELYFEVQEFIHHSIKKYFGNPKYYKGIYEWCDEKCENNDSITDSPYRSFARERFKSFTRIRKYYSVSDDRFAFLPEQHKDSKVNIAIADWIFYCEMLPYNLETISAKQDVFHPLAEYEYINILATIIKKQEEIKIESKDDNYFEKNNLFNIEINFDEWKLIRNEIIKKDFYNNDSLRLASTHYYAKLLFSLLTNQPVHSHITKEYSLYKWNDLQSYFELTYYPSSKVASFFVDNLNIHQEFYQDIYGAPYERLPYREAYHSNRSDHGIVNFIKDYSTNIENELIFKKYNRKLELLEIDTDQLRG